MSTKRNREHQAYVSVSECIDWQHPSVRNKAGELARGATDQLDVIRACFRFVRDEIAHSSDYQLNPVTCKASEVLQYGTGFCYAKSHLLAALLRANSIPAGLCYQRLRVIDDQPRLSLHGLNAVFLPDSGWLRIDARGNKAGVNARFIPPEEHLAFAVRFPGEADLPEIWPEPLPLITRMLGACDTFAEVLAHLPDIELVNC